MAIPSNWLEVLFGLRDFERGQGLYSPRTIGKEIESIRGVAFGPVGQQGKLAGLTIQIHGYEFRLLMSAPSSEGRNFLGDLQVYRPLEFHCTDGASDKSILLSWEGPSDGGTIHILNKHLAP